MVYTETCPVCDGSGKIITAATICMASFDPDAVCPDIICPECNGNGKRESYESNPHVREE